jgi:hypothetical protein
MISSTVFLDGSVPEVDYPALRGMVNDGDLLLCSGSLTFSRLIQAATRSIWSHVAMLLWAPQIERIIVFESVESIGVRAVTLSSYVKDYNGTGEPYPGRLLVARHTGLRKGMISPSFSQFAVERLGYPYHKEEIAEIAFLMASGGRLAHEQRFSEAKRFICSEYVHTCYQQLGIEVQQGDAHFVAPADFANDPNVVAIGIPGR